MNQYTYLFYLLELIFTKMNKKGVNQYSAASYKGENKIGSLLWFCIVCRFFEIVEVSKLPVSLSMQLQ